MNYDDYIHALREVPAGLVASLVSHLRAAERVFLIGNGGSLAIASHMACDLQTQAGIRAFTPTDSTMLTALANDNGYEDVFVEWLAQFRATRRDLLIAMSCSGQSGNVGKAVSGFPGQVFMMTGAAADSPLGKLSNLRVASVGYGVVQVVHFVVLHAACDALAEGTS